MGTAYGGFVDNNNYSYFCYKDKPCFSRWNFYADGELVAQKLENGFDRGAMEVIHEYLAGKGIA